MPAQSPFMSRVAAATQTNVLPPGAAAVVKLTKPIEGHEGLIHQIALKEPTYGDWLACGDMFTSTMLRPVDGAERVQIEVDTRAVSKWVHRLTGLPNAVLAQMSYEDFKAVFAEVNALVGKQQKGNSTTPPPTSG